MDKVTKPISSSCNNGDDGVPQESGMDRALSDLQALKKLYGLLQRLDDESSSKNLLNKLLDDATRQALLKQAKALTTTTASDSVVPFSLGLTTSPKKTDQATTLSSSSVLNNKEADTMEQVLSDLETLTSLYRLLHKGPGPADEDLDVASRALLMKILEDATQEAVQRQAKLLSGSSLASPALERKMSTQSNCRTRHADPRLTPVVASPRPSLLASDRSQSRRLYLQHSTVSRRSGVHVDAHRHAPEEPEPRLATNRSSRTALPARCHRPSQEQRQSRHSLHRSPVPGTPSRHGTVAGRSTWLADRRESIRRSSGRGDRCSPERTTSSSRRSVSREMPLGPSSRLRGRATPRHVGTESASSVRLDSWLSLSTTSRHGVEHAGRGVATPERSSSSNTVATIQSRIRPSSNLLMERPRFAVQKKTSRGRQQSHNDVSSADMDMYSSMSSGSRSSSGAASPSAFTSPTTTSPVPRAFANPYYYSPPVTAPRGIVPPVYAPEVSRSMRRRRRQEILEKRVARLRMLKDKIATMFHHLHDHHHQRHHHLGGGQEAGPSSRSVVHGAGHLINSPWQYLTSMFHHGKGKDKNTKSRAVVGVPEKKRGGGGGGHMHALFDAVRRHLKGKRRAPLAGMKLRRKASRVLANKKMHWWQRLRQQRSMAGVTAGRPRHRLGHGFKI